MRLDALHRLASAALAAERHCSEDIRDATAEVQRLEAEERIQRERHPGTWRTVRRGQTASGQPFTEQTFTAGPTPDLMSDLEVARRRRAECCARLDRLREASAPLLQLHSRCTQFLEDHRIDADTLIAASIGLASSTAEPTRSLDDVTTLRRDIHAARAERRRLEHAPCAEAEAHARIDDWIVARVAELEVSAAAFTRARPGGFRMLSTDDGEYSRASDRRMIESLFAATSPVALRSVLHAAAAREAERAGGWGLPSSERTARLAALDAQIFQLESDEERAIESLEAHGVAVTRRADADPRAVLRLDEIQLEAVI